jgi:hypothetical protein
MVIWAKEEATYDLPAKPEACFDHLGRPHAITGHSLTIGPAPLYVVFAKGAHPKLKSPPDRAKLLSARPGVVVLQALVPVENRSLEKSAYYLTKGEVQKVPVFVYNFGADMAKGKLRLKVPEGWKGEITRDIELDPMGRKELELSITSPAGGWSEGRARIDGEFGGAGESVLSLEFVAK